MAQEQQLDFSTILASTIHDMKNSLGMVLNSLEEIVDSESGECRCSGDQVAKLQYEAKRVNSNLIQLLTLYKLEHQQVSANINEYSVADFLEECLLQAKPILAFRDIEAEIDCPDDLYGYFDRDLVAGVLNNALDNAIRYTKSRLRLVAEVEDGGLVLGVEDDGAGFPGSMLIAGNDPAANQVSFASGRTGLGLYFSSLVAAMHRNRSRAGYIELTNGGALGGGRFVIHIP